MCTLLKWSCTSHDACIHPVFIVCGSCMELENQIREKPSDAFAQDGLSRGCVHHNRPSGHFCFRRERVALGSCDAHMRSFHASTVMRERSSLGVSPSLQNGPEFHPQQIVCTLSRRPGLQDHRSNHHAPLKYPIRR